TFVPSFPNCRRGPARRMSSSCGCCKKGAPSERIPPEPEIDACFVSSEGTEVDSPTAPFGRGGGRSRRAGRGGGTGGLGRRLGRRRGRGRCDPRRALRLFRG